MNDRIHQLAVLALLILTPAITVSAARPIPLDELFPPKVVAKGNGFQVTEKDVEKAYLDYTTAAAANGQQVDIADRENLESRLLDKLVFMRIMLLKATSEDQESGAKRADELLAAFKKRSSSEDAFQRYIASLNLTYAEFHNKFKEQAVVEEVLLREVHKTLTASDDEMKRFYLDNIEAFRQPEMVRVAHILVSTRNSRENRPLTDQEKRAALSKAEALLKRAKAGEDFAKLVEMFSEDPGSKSHGGIYAFARGQMAVEFETAAFALQPGQLSDVIETGYGFHVIKMLDRRPSRTLPYEASVDRVRKAVIDGKAEAILPNYTRQIRAAFGTVILDPAYKQEKP
ncbi:MAG: peptidylprolyl isomerase [Verrucomicrobiae bacterium]|nr:peptidylprolyl isomerase [Verrucomicrobiae bacterium]